jgi:hypothetical protein
MAKVLSPLVHGLLDYALALGFLLVPGILDFSQDATSVSYIAGVVYLGASLLTRYPLGAIRAIPFSIHGVMESIMAAAWIVMPWIFDFADDTGARSFFMVAGIGLLLITALTDRRQQSLAVAAERRTPIPERRSYA